MGIFIEWADAEKTILRQVFQGRWDVTDFNMVIDAMIVLMGEVKHRVDVILDFSGTTSGQEPTRLLPSLQRFQRVRPANAGAVVYVQANAFLRSLIEIAYKQTRTIKNQPFHFAASLPEALAFLKDPDRSPID